MTGQTDLLIEKQIFESFNNWNVPADCPVQIVYDRKEHKKIAYTLLPITFDIETTNTYSKQGFKIAFMYVWQACVFGHYVYGRTWSEWQRLIEMLNDVYSKYKSEKVALRFTCYVHNLSYEFAWLSSLFEIEKVFAKKNRKVMYVLTKNNVIYKCSYFLSGYSLKKVGEHLKTPIVKDYSRLDYSSIRTYDTVLTGDELTYCFYDVYILYEYILEMIDKYEYIYKIPLTKTACVRNDCYNKLKQDEKSYKALRKLIVEMTPTADEYRLLQKAYWGAYVHGRADIIGKTLENVDSYDFSSSYPYQLATGLYPVSHFIYENNSDNYKEDLNIFACIVKCRLLNVLPNKKNHILSINNCDYLENDVVDNGRLVSADIVDITLTSVDLKLLYMFYDFELEIHDLWYAYQDYLPKNLIELVLSYYSQKTTLKGIDGKESEYMWLKECNNSLYGCAVTKPCNDTINFLEDGTWFDIPWDKLEVDGQLIDKSDDEIQKTLNRYYKNEKQFLTYSWGCWCTANARYALLQVIAEIDEYVFYGDTDSIKAKSCDAVRQAVDAYNKNVLNDIQDIVDEYDIDINLFSPRNNKGETYTLGLFCYEGTYSRFKTLGAKKYLSEIIKNNEKQVKLTVSGCGASAIDFMKKSDKDIFELFDDGLIISKKFSGRTVIEYFNTGFTETITDYQGHTSTVCEKSYCHISETEYTFGLAYDFLKYILSLSANIQEVLW